MATKQAAKQSVLMEENKHLQDNNTCIAVPVCKGTVLASCGTPNNIMNTSMIYTYTRKRYKGQKERTVKENKGKKR